MNARSPSAARADPIQASSSSGAAFVYRSGSGCWSRIMLGITPVWVAFQLADGADSLVALHGDVVPGTDLLPETKPALGAVYSLLRLQPSDVGRVFPGAARGRRRRTRRPPGRTSGPSTCGRRRAWRAGGARSAWRRSPRRGRPLVRA